MRILGLALGWGWAASIVWLSLTPSPPSVGVAFSDKLGHFAAYGALMFWFALLYAHARARALYALAFVAMGVGLEIIQGALGYRTYELLDMAANTTGVLLGWAGALLVRRPIFR
jgi:VanZ family protein